MTSPEEGPYQKYADMARHPLMVELDQIRAYHGAHGSVDPKMIAGVRARYLRETLTEAGVRIGRVDAETVERLAEMPDRAVISVIGMLTRANRGRYWVAG